MKNTTFCKALSVFLAALMIALSCPLSIFAEGERIQLVTYDTDGVTPTNTELFADLASAVNAVDKGANQVIKLLGDIEVGSQIVPSWLGEYDPANMRTVKIDGRKADNSGNYKITVGNHIFFKNMAYYNFEMSNVDMVLNAVGVDGVFNWEAQVNSGNANYNSQAQTTKFTNCTISVPDGNAKDTGGGGNLFKIKGNGNTSSIADEYTLIFDGCTITDNSANIALIHHGAKADIQVKDTTVKHTGGTSQGSNYSIFVINHTNSSATISVTGSSVLESALPAENTGSTSAILATQNADSAATLTLGAGVVLYLNSAEDKTNNRFVQDTAAVQVIDQGAVWKASATMAQKGVTLPGNVTLAGTEFPCTWKVGNTAVEGATYTDANASADVIFTAVAGTSANNVAYIAGATAADNRYFTSLTAAVQAATNGSVIYLLRDINEGFDALSPPSNISLTIDGAKTGGGVYTITNTHANAGRYFMECGSSNVTFRNLKIVSDKGLRFHGTTDGTYSTTLKNVTLEVDGGLAMKIGQNTLGAYDATRTFHITIEDSTITSDAADAVINAGVPTKFNIVIKNSTVEQKKSTGGDNGYIFNFFNKNGGTLDLQAGTVIKNSASSGSTSGILSVHDQQLRNADTDPWTQCPMVGNVTLTMASGVQLILSSSTATTNKYFNNANGKLVISNDGATYKASAGAVKKGITLPELGEGKAWFVGGTAISNTYTDANATSEVTFVTGTLSSSDPMENPANVAYTEVGGVKTFYTSLSAAINAVATGDSPVIHLIRDMTVGSAITPSWLGEYDPANMRTVKIDGLKADNTRVTVTVSDGFFNNLAYYNLEMSNLDMIFNAVGKDGVFAWEAQCNTGNANRSSQTQTTKFTNCSFTAPDGNALDSGAGGNFFKLKGNGKDGTTYAGDLDIYNVIFDGCTMVENAGNILIVHHGASANITVKDTHIKHTGGATSSNVSVFKFFDCDGVTLRITGSSVIESALPEAAPGEGTYMIWWMDSADKEASHMLVLDATATLYLNSAADRTDNHFIKNGIGKKLVVEDAGASYKASATMLKNGVYLPDLSLREGTHLGWSDGEALVSKGGDSKYTVASATEDGVYKPVKVGTFKMLSGASIHTSGDYGIRFETEISNDLVALLGESITLHMWIMPEAFLGNSSFVKSSLFEGEYRTFDLGEDQITATGTDTTTYSGDLLGIPKRAGGVTTRFTARAYLRVTYADGSVGYIYSEYDKTANTRSIAEVAQAAYNAGITDNATINEILALQ